MRPSYQAKFVIRTLMSIAFGGMVTMGCKKDPIVTSPLIVGETIAYIIAAGDTVILNSSSPGFITDATVYKTIGFPDSSSAIYASQLYQGSALHPAIIIKKGTLNFSDTIADEADFINFFETGVQEWSVNAFNGVEVIYVDPQGTVWSTSEVGGYQGSHQFTITEAIPFIDNGERCVKIKAVFDCTLYHPAYQPIDLLKGVYIGIFRNL
jgi:hypothetical protein